MCLCRQSSFSFQNTAKTVAHGGGFARKKLRNGQEKMKINYLSMGGLVILATIISTVITTLLQKLLFGKISIAVTVPVVFVVAASVSRLLWLRHQKQNAATPKD